MSVLSLPVFYLLNFVCQSSVFVREWVTSHWSQNATVNLVEELPALKDMILSCQRAEDLERQQHEAEYEQEV